MNRLTESLPLHTFSASSFLLPQKLFCVPSLHSSEIQSSSALVTSNRHKVSDATQVTPGSSQVRYSPLLQDKTEANKSMRWGDAPSFHLHCLPPWFGLMGDRHCRRSSLALQIWAAANLWITLHSCNLWATLDLWRDGICSITLWGTHRCRIATYSSSG